MPLIVVGADTPIGRQVLEGLTRKGEVRVFVSDEAEAMLLRGTGVKVALGDISDESHVEMASWGCHSAVLVAEAAEDDRERSFAEDAAAVLRGWARAMSTAGVKRVIWVGPGEPPASSASEVAVVDPTEPGFVERVAALDSAQSI